MITLRNIALSMSLLFSPSLSGSRSGAPNIVFVLMDDLGWHDVSYNGGQFPTPNIDALKDESVSLNKHYIHLMCSPSRTQFLTGRYAMRQGIGKMLPWDYTEIGGIPVGQATIADWLKASGYNTYAVGKWHCGYAYEGLLPTSRGFDHFFGFYQGAIHYGSMQYIDIKFGESAHYDFWEDTKEFKYSPPDGDDSQINTMHLYRDKLVDYIRDEAAASKPRDVVDEEGAVEGKEDGSKPFYMYVPLQTIHGPLDRVHEYVDQCEEILGGNVARRSKYCQNMLLTDDVIGAMINALKDYDFWDNTLFVLTSDNGADIANRGCNFPLRGTKGTLFDGNTKTIALIGGGAVPAEQYGTTRESLFSSLDWTPTLLHYAGTLDMIDSEDYSWDGVDQYELIMQGDEESLVHRDHIVFNIGLQSLESASLVFFKDQHLYKYIAQDAGIDQWSYKREDGWCVPEPNGDWNMVMDEDVSLAQHVDNKYLFDLTIDSAEKTNLLQLEEQSDDNEDVIQYAKDLMTSYTEHALYSEHLKFLWQRMESGDPSLQGEGSFVAPFLSADEYFHHLSAGFTRLEDQQSGKSKEKREFESLPFTKKLKALYFHKWEAPDYMAALSGDANVVDVMESNAQQADSVQWYVYLIVAIVVGCCILIAAVSIAKYKANKKAEGYQPISQREDAEDIATGQMNGNEEYQEIADKTVKIGGSQAKAHSALITA